jgi:penicillin-binding protein 1C
LRGKCEQIWRALQLERHYSKAQLLEAYLNLAPYGGNIEGVGAASAIILHKNAQRLTAHEAATLSAIPQRPNRFRVASRPTLLAPHFTTEILRETNAGEIRSTLDLDLQQTLERRIAEYIEANSARGIHNAAAMLIDHRTMEVLAQVGSADFANEAIDGQVDATRSPRSPGSTLKPFVYALAIDQGLIHPLTMLKDAPRSFGGFDPENFDAEFVGPIKACDALARSRNIPAVTLAAELTDPTLYQFLRNAGVVLPRDEKFYGLALPLGGAEITMQQLVTLYAALANGGELRTLRRTFAPNESRQRLISPEAAFLTLEMLGEIPRPGVSESSAGDAIFWKTGTSHGFHDAWSVCVFDHFVLAVWVGNADGKSNPAFVGRTCAAPLLFQIVDTLRANGRARARRLDPPANANLRAVEFCAVSGQLPTSACPHRVHGWFIPGVSPISECEVHRELLVDAETGLRVNSDDGRRMLRREVHEFWPSDLLELFAAAGLPRRVPPPFSPGTNVEMIKRLGKAPHITSPKNELTYSLSSGTLALRAEAEADVAKIYWFAGTEFLGVAPRGASLEWQPRSGHCTIVAMDDHGRCDSRVVACFR